MLVQKNHRREQSATATAGRHNKNDHWGDTTDERRVGSCERASEEYQIMGGSSRK